MRNNRRKFLQKLGVCVSALGMSTSLPAQRLTQSSATSKDDRILAAAAHAVVETIAGKVRGYTRNSIFTFKGIPYATSTAGEARFMPPAKLTPWKNVRDALVYGPVCPQKPNIGWTMDEYAFLYQWNDGFQSEDCLRLNVWTPGIQALGKSSGKRPVMVWLHGGGFFSGSSQEHPSYDGENLSRLGDVVVVSVNHRLNVFGFMDLSAYGSKYAQSGNVGMLDLVAALEWVRDNIRRFGGDPGNVTIFGQSGGAAKVTTLMGMPSAKGLFHKAISQSSSTVQLATREYAAQFAQLVVDELGLTNSTIDRIHQVPFTRLVEASVAAEKKLGPVPANMGRAGWQPVVDGTVIPAAPFDSAIPAYSANIPMLIGSNRNEASASIGDAGVEALSEEGLKKKLAEKYKEKSTEVYQVLRKVHPIAKPVELLSYLSPYNPLAYLQAERKVAQQGAPVYMYMFAWHTPVLDGRPRAFHCSEIPFAFANTDRSEAMTGGGEEARALASKVCQAWVNFARTGNPTHKNLHYWPAFSTDKGAIMFLNKVCEVRRDPDGEARKLLERIFYKKDF